MKKILLHLAVFTILFGTGFWLNESGGALHGQQVIATGQFQCDGADHTAVWSNGNRSVRVRQAQIWMGMFADGKADFWFWIELEGGGTMGHTNWDHYAEPTIPHMVHYTYAPDFIHIAPGETVKLFYGCSSIDGNSTVGDVALTLWWLK